MQLPPTRFVSFAHKTEGGKGWSCFRVIPKGDSANVSVLVHNIEDYVWWLEEAMVERLASPQRYDVFSRCRRQPSWLMSDWISLGAIHTSGAYPKYHSIGSPESRACWIWENRVSPTGSTWLTEQRRAQYDSHPAWLLGPLPPYPEPDRNCMTVLHSGRQRNTSNGNS